MHKLIAAAGLALSLSACQTFADYVNAANALDPECGKRVHVEVVPFLTPIGVFPMIKEATYDKACNLDQFQPRTPLTPLGPGLTVGAPVG